MKTERILWQVLPQSGLFGWKLVRNGKFVRSYLFQKGAIAEANRCAQMEWECYRWPAEIDIHCATTGEVREKTPYPKAGEE